MDLALPGSILPESTDVKYALHVNNEGLASYPTGTYVYFKAKAMSHCLFENEYIASCRAGGKIGVLRYLRKSTKYI